MDESKRRNFSREETWTGRPTTADARCDPLVPDPQQRRWSSILALFASSLALLLLTVPAEPYQRWVLGIILVAGVAIALLNGQARQSAQRDTFSAQESVSLFHAPSGTAPSAKTIDFEQLLQRLPLPVFLLDEERTVIFANDALGNLYRTTPRQLVEVAEADARVRRLREQDLFAPSALDASNEWLSTIEGRVHRFQLLRERLPTTDDFPAIELVLVLDVTEPHRLQLQLQFSQRLEILGTLASGLAHDFNNLLTPILGYSSLLLDSDAIAAHRDKLQAITDAAYKARRISEQMLNFTGGRPAAGRRERIELPEAVSETKRFIEATVAKAVTLEVEVVDGCAVLMDPGELNQVLMNLATNAVQAMGSTGGTLKLRIYQRPAGAPELPEPLRSIECACIDVCDDGPGMSETLQQHIFEPFFTTKEQNKGTGLGLSVSRNIVEQNCGALRCTSRLGEGSTFTLIFPALPAMTDTGDDKPKRVMLIEAQSAVLSYLSDILHAMGFEVSRYSDATAAVQALDRQLPSKESRWSLVVLGSTEQDEHELRRTIRRAHPTLPIALLPNSSGDDQESPSNPGNIVVLHRVLRDALQDSAVA